MDHSRSAHQHKMMPTTSVATCRRPAVNARIGTDHFGDVVTGPEKDRIGHLPVALNDQSGTERPLGAVEVSDAVVADDSGYVDGEQPARAPTRGR